MNDRAAKLQEIRDRQNRWRRERQAELDREQVVSELQSQQRSSTTLPALSPQRQAPAGAARGPPAPSAASASGAPSLAASYTGAPLHGSTPAGAINAIGGMGAMGAGGGGTSSGLPTTLGGVGGVKPEEVIDRLTERITDRLRSELKVELQRESESLAAQERALDTYLVKELETQNTCPVCYEVMVPPMHAPMMLFPCGHSFCARCLEHHIDRNKKTQCPICRKKIDSRAPNYSLQQLIQQVVAKKESTTRRGPGGAPSPGGGSGGGGEGLMLGGGEAAAEALMGAEPGSNADRVRRQYDRAATRLRVLRNELTDTEAEEAALGGRVAAAVAVVGHLTEEEQQVLRRLAAVQAELELVREQLGAQGAKAAELARQAEGVRQRKELLQATLAPLEGEVEKLEVLMSGLAEL